MTAQPSQTLKDTLTGSRAAGLDLPGVVLGHDAQVQCVGHLLWLHAAGYILLVGEDEEERVFHFAVLNDARQFRARFFDTVAVVAVDYEDQTLGSWNGC